ncbi:MAG TPA: DUF4349 domain-containing protein [Solirubrobacteraceae bacterium]|nr:DUF4349 domain-containing protein [Solirubrobacteraceae bacterium]
MSLPESVTRDLEVVDRALTGAAVDPADAELAELALLLAAARPEPSAEAAARLDARVGTRLALITRPSPDRPARRGRGGRAWVLRPAFGAGLGLCVALMALVLVVGHGGGSSSGASGSGAAATSGPVHAGSSAAAGSFAVNAPSHAGPAAPPALGGPTLTAPGPLASAPGASADSAPAVPSAPAGPAVPLPQLNGRRVIHSDQLTLATSADQIATVAQELFDVVGSERGIVKTSQVSSGSGAYASFVLSIPTANLSTTLARLGQLRGARIISSSASTTDVNSAYLDDQRALADARALRSSLLRQLAAATTTAAITSLQTQIHDAEQSIARQEGNLNRLNSAISFTTVSVQINPGSVPGPRPARQRSGLAAAWHTALDVLGTMAAVALVALAVLVPLGLVLGLAGWVWTLARRRAREHALDAA